MECLDIAPAVEGRIKIANEEDISKLNNELKLHEYVQLSKKDLLQKPDFQKRWLKLKQTLSSLIIMVMEQRRRL